MVYSGVFTQSGAPVAAQIVAVTLGLYDQGNVQLCTPSTSHPSTDTLGRFIAAFDGTCNDVLLSAQPVVLRVDVSYSGSTLTQRRQLGVVPYAVEALHAVQAEEATVADRATPGGALDLRIAGLAPFALASDGGQPLYAVIAGFCGATQAFDGAMVNASNPLGNSQGYQGTSPICVNSGVCGAEGTPHMCTAEEMVRSASMGRVPAGTRGWYAGGVQRDCMGYTSHSPTDLGLYWDDGVPSSLPCVGAYPVLCCK
jgi:hypothetical protein